MIERNYIILMRHILPYKRNSNTQEINRGEGGMIMLAINTA